METNAFGMGNRTTDLAAGLTISVLLAIAFSCSSHPAIAQASIEDRSFGSTPLIPTEADVSVPKELTLVDWLHENNSGVAATIAPALSFETPQNPTTVESLHTPFELAAAPVSTAQTNAELWQKLRPLLPKPGSFAIVPGSELRPILVGKNEFDFCTEIKCYRSASVLGAWNGGAFNGVRGEFRVHGGGHADYGGNEVYAFDFANLRWTRETDPQPLTGPFLRDTDGDGVTDSCPAPASGPPATHTYQGFLYVPKIDRYWLFGTVEYCRGAMGGSSAWEYDAHTKTWMAMPELDKFARFARAVVDPGSGNVIVHVGRERGWHEIDPASRNVVRTFKADPFGSYLDGPAVFDQKRHKIYALIGGSDTDRLVAYDWPSGKSEGFDGRLIAEWPKSGRKIWGMAQHASGLLVLWNGGKQTFVVDPESGKSWGEQPNDPKGAATGPDDEARKVYSKWSYIPELDTFFGIADPDQGIVLYRLAATPAEHGSTVDQSPASIPSSSMAAASQKTATLPNVGRPVPIEIDATDTWERVCTTAILCDPIGEGDVIYRGHGVASGPAPWKKNWRSIGQKFSHPDAKAATPDPEIGGLRFIFPSHSKSGAAGNFRVNFSPDYSFQIGAAEAGAPAQEAYIQFQVRYSCTFIWTDCDPDSFSYRKQRRCFLSTRGDGKCTASKIALISTGDRDDFSADACTRMQIALNHGTDHALNAFHRCPRAEGFGERMRRVGGRYQGDSQPNGAYSCPRILPGGTARRWNGSSDSCFRLIDDRWITIQIHLRYGPWQNKREKGDPELSHVSIWAGVEAEDGGRQKLVIDNDFAASSPENVKDFIGKIWLMPHLYAKSDKEDHPPFFVWYRNLIVSQDIIPNPG